MDEEEIKRRVIFDTGYGKPPQYSQFKKGQSGNPKGRPKTVANELSLTDQRTLKMILDVADRVVPVRENGEVRHMKMLEVAINALYLRSGKGDPRALATLFAMTQKGEMARARDIQKRNEFWQDYKNAETARIAEAKACGEPVPEPLPHPDDIIIDHEKGPRFLGPITEQEQVKLDHTVRMRDVLILQNELDHRSKERLNGEPLTEPGGAELFAMVLEKVVPPRLRLSNVEWAWQAMKTEGLPKRELLKQLYEQWRKLGYRLPRGFVFPNMSCVNRQLEQRIAIAKELHALPSPDDMPQGEWERAAVKIISGHLGIADKLSRAL